MNQRFADDSAVRLAYETYEKFQPNILTSDLPLIWINQSISQIFYLNLVQNLCQSIDKNVNKQIIGSLLIDQKLPIYFRVNSMIMNSVHFSKLFDCRDGTTMNPEFKAGQFPYIDVTEIDYIHENED